MSTPSEPRNHELPSTYIVQDRENQAELARLELQDHLLTTSMGGVLAEQEDPTKLRRVLDIGCGPGGWIIEAATAYPMVNFTGIDISKRMITYARQQAQDKQVAERVDFLVMDALLLLEFPNGYFDLTNLRLGGSLLRTWDWPKMLSEMLRVTRKGGVIRLTDQEIMHRSNSPATTRLNEKVLCAFYQAGHLFEQNSTGITARLPLLLQQYGCNNVQTKAHVLEYRAGTPEGQAYSEDMALASRTLMPFIRKWGCMSEDYEALYQQSLLERQKSDFYATWHFLTAWGSK
ncbi:class I SAM-dependent methyltransferase [Ktedonosporobacter rubrisoli]|uniref:Class I SAM-dependent methyltransferase n=1 Tax=Ktedonosporobacter rubrisoli TaxID=2509675 RepID=A0A4P6K291_KTERU|nr:class I SAM-dependent methyltransferase [Ktedonosporobacter rubrisoli]QBD81596.1 class I SAM-dependent methyltransferase [Ktedonosporobacter rubrisoli]